MQKRLQMQDCSQKQYYFKDKYIPNKNLMSSENIHEAITDSLISKEQNSESLHQQKKNFLARAFGPIRKGALRAAILTLLASSMGTGIFNLPERVQQIGLIPFVIFVVICALYSYWGMQLIAQIMTAHHISSYSEMTQKAYGMGLRRVAEFCLIIYPWGITICFQVILARFSTQLLYDIFNVDIFQDRQTDKLNNTGILIRILINVTVIIVSMIFILKRQIETIKKLAYIGVVSVLFNVAIVIGTSLIGFTRVDKQTNVVYHGVFNRQSGDLNWFGGDVSSIFQGIASIFFCYVSHQMVFPLVQDLRNPSERRLTKIFFRSHLTLFLVYGSIGLFGYLLLVEHNDRFPIQPVIIASITTDIMSFGKSIMVVALFVAVSLNMFPARTVFVQTFKIDTTGNRNHILVCAGMAISSCIIAISFVKVNSYFGLLGGTAGVMMAGGIPALCYYKLMPLSTKHYIQMAVIFVVTILAMVGAVLSVVMPV